MNTDILVTGTVPAGSGLSSSAAMVVASTLAFLAVNDKLDISTSDGTTRRITKGELVSMAVENEKRVGVNSGGYVYVLCMCYDAIVLTYSLLSPFY